MDSVINIMGYISTTIIGIALIYSAINAVAYLSKLSDNKDNRLLDFISRHSYGSTIALIVIFFMLFAFASFATMERLAYEELEEERVQLDEEYDSIYDNGYDTGYDEGYEYGYLEGFNDGEAEGWDKGYEAGYDTAYEDYN